MRKQQRNMKMGLAVPSDGVAIIVSLPSRISGVIYRFNSLDSHRRRQAEELAMFVEAGQWSASSARHHARKMA